MDNNPALAFQPRDIVRHRIHHEPIMRVTAVDELRGRWVCCTFQTGSHSWHNERFKPEDLELLERPV